MVDLKGTYFSIEDKWYSFVDTVSDKLPVFGNIVDTIEEKNIPSFPLAIAIMLILLIIIFLAFTNTGTPLTITVVDDNQNYVSGANVSVFLDGKIIGERETDSEGNVTFIIGSETYTVKIDKDGFVSKTKDVSAGDQKFVLNQEAVSLTKAISLNSASGELLNGDGIVKYSCISTGEEKIGNYENGVFNADFSDCQDISLNSVSGYVIVRGTASFNGANDIILTEEENNTGTITVTVNAEEDLEGVRVTIRGEDGTPTQVKSISSGTNIAVFEDVPTKKYYITVHDPQGNYQDYDGSALGELKELAKDQTISFNLTLTKTTNSIITVNVIDAETSLPVIGAEVKLKNAQTQDVLNSEVSGISGEVEFNVSEDSEYIISAEHPEYIVGQNLSATSNQTITFNLVKATEANSKTLLVKVIDPRNNPIRNVNVTVKKLDDTEIGEKTTGSNGTVEFYNVEPASYYAYAVKDGYTGATSTTIQVLPLRENILTVTLDIGEGDVDLTVKDDSFALASGAKVSAINYYTNEIEEEKTSSQEGMVNFKIREDKKVYFKVEQEGFLDYYTSAFNADSGSTITKEIVLSRSNDRVTAKILGIYTSEGEIGAERVIGPGNYTIKALLEVPKGNFSESGLHIRTGKASDNEINLMEEDLARLGKVESSADIILKGTTFSPPNNYSIDSSNFTNGTSKWIEAKWKNPLEGSYEVEIELLVEDVNPNTGINLFYRGYAKGGTTLRSVPNNNPGHELYASASNYLLVSGATNLCKENFCINKEITTLTGGNAGRTQYISNRFNAKQDNEYVFKASLISRKLVNDAVIEIDESGIEIESIIVNGNETDDQANIGTIMQDTVTNIEIKFNTVNSGTSNIKLKVNSSSNTELEENTIINVAANKKMNVELIPRQIIPYVNNLIFVEVKDGNTPLKNALVEIKINDNIVSTLETTSEGLAQYELTMPSIGDTITINISKEGYNNIQINKDVDERLLIITPPQINETIKIGEVTSIENQILIENATVNELVLSRINVNGELDEYATVTLSDAEGQVIKAEEDANFYLKIKPNSKAKLLREPKTVTGTLQITTKVEGSTQSFVSEIPISIRLSMPGFLDSASCLHVSPSNLEFITSNKEATESIEIENTCTAEGININLFELEAKVNELSKLGTISISGVGLTGGNIGENYNTITDTLESNEKINAVVRFMPNSGIASGTQNLTFNFRATNQADEDVSESIESEISASVSLSNLSKCVEIEEPSDGINLNIAGWNLGYNRIVNSNMSSHVNNYPGFSGMNRMPYGMTQNLPFMGNGSDQYEQNSFTIKNNCAAEIDVDLDADSRLSVGDEKFTISAGNDSTVTISPGYTLGKYEIKVNAGLNGTTTNKKERIETVDVTVRKLGDIDKDCIKTSVRKIKFNSFLYESQKYKVYNHCYNTGVILNRTNTINIACDAPNRTTNQEVPYLQVGMEPLYSNTYPINNTHNSYNQYLQPQKTGINNCSMIAGTRTLNQIVNNGVEEIEFEIMPSAQYVPQRRLFDEQRNTYGLFHNLADVRQWATETDGRTEVYGNLIVNYTNQYGSNQKMEFPITIEDNWRALESIDSAINWGDPKAKPSECIGEDQKNSLNIKNYWNQRGNKNGEIPNAEFNEQGNYLYIAEPPAVQIGPSPSVGTIYPQTNWWSNNKQQAGTKNCGLTDSLSNIKYDDEFGGVKIKVESLRKGSLTNNTLGPNLAVEINRSGIQHNCVYINTTVSADLKRTINWQKENVSWKLTALVLNPGYKIQPGFNPQEDCYIAGSAEIDCETLTKNYKDYAKFVKEYPRCEKEITPERFKELITKAESENTTCEINSSEYGMDKVDAITTEEMKSNIDDYCKENFCNKEMLQYYLLNKYQKIHDELKEISDLKDKAVLAFKGKDHNKLEEIYRIGSTMDVNVCNSNKKYYKNVIIPVDMKEITEKNLNETDLESLKENGTLGAMKTVLENITDEDQEYFLKTENEYIPLEAYKKLINKATSVDDDATIEIGISDCNNFKTFTANQVKEMLGKTNIVKLVKAYKNDYSNEEINEIYKANNNLETINELSEFGLYLAQIEKGSMDYSEEIFTGTDIGEQAKLYNVNLKNNSDIGKYKVILKADFVKMSNISNDNPETITINLSNREKYKKAENNILLQKGFKLNTKIEDPYNNAINGIIVNKEGKFYARSPINLTADIPAQDNLLKYKLEKGVTSETSLISWKIGNIIENDSASGISYVIMLPNSGVARRINGVYYAPKEANLIFSTNGGEIEVNAKSYLDNKTFDVKATKTGNILELTNIKQPTIKDIIQKLDDTTCFAEEGNTIIWNTKELRG